MMNGLDLFSGIGGLTLALEPWVRPIAYCENDRHAQGVLLSRMREGAIASAPIWDDVQTLRADEIPGPVDIIYGGFPCQDISAAGRGAGLEGKRSGLFFEVIRLTDELRPTFVFLENVPAIRTRGLDTVVKEFSGLGYDCRWTLLSASELGAPHIRKRWWLMASNSNSRAIGNEQGWGCGKDGKDSSESGHNGEPRNVADAQGIGWRERRPQSAWIERGPESSGGRRSMANSMRQGRQRFRSNESGISESKGTANWIEGSNWWATEPNVGRVAHGVSARVDRLRGLGNAVVPLCAREAFKRLIGQEFMNEV